MVKYVIGIDTGATKSHLALFDTEGNLIDFDQWGPLNHEELPGSFDQFEEEVSEFTDKVLKKNHLSIKQISYSVFGIAGVDTNTQHDIISGIFRKIGFEKFTLANDAFLGIPAGNPKGTGICAINGTGSTLAGVNKEGKMLQIGGVGFISADYGGGGMMGELVISSVYKELFRKGEKTCMTCVLLEKIGCTDKYDFVDKVYKRLEDRTLKIPSCAIMIFDAAKKGDKLAQKILRDVGESYAQAINCMIEELSFPRNEELRIVLAGSVFVKGEHPLLLDTLKEVVSAANPDHQIKYVLLKVPPVAGAVVWALNSLGDNGASYDKVCSQLK